MPPELADATLLDALLVQAAVGIAALDEELRCVRANTALADITTVPLDGWLGRPIREVAAPGREALAAIAEEVLRSGTPAPVTRVHPRAADRGASGPAWDVSA